MSRILMLFSFSLGVFSVGFWPGLPAVSWLLLPLIFSFLLYTQRLYVRSYKAIACLLWGIIYGVCWGHYTLSHQLPEKFNPAEMAVTGEVVGLPTVEDNRTQFYLKILAVGDESKIGTELKKLRLNWYGSLVNIEPGQVWRLRVKLRRPRGTVNHGGFDYQAWLLRQGVSATGYVRKSNENRLLQTENSLGALRFKIREVIVNLPLAYDVKSLIVALTVGDRSMITSELWDALALSGIVHLMVISGLHIGLIAYFFYLFGSGISRLIGAFGLLTNASYWGCICSLLASVVYASLAGFSLPTQRALVMICVAIVALLLDRKISRGLGFGLALSGVAIIDPLAFLSAGFWLSFGAVACLLWLVPVYTEKPGDSGDKGDKGDKGDRGKNTVGHTVREVAGKRLRRILSWSFFTGRLKQFFYIQWLLFIALTIPLMLFQLPVSWFAPWINMLAIPWVSFAIVPLCLTGTALLPINEAWAVEIWAIAGWQLNYFIDLIGIVSTPSNLPRYFPLPHYLPLPKTGAVCVALILMLVLLLLPRGIPGKYLTLSLLLVLFLASSDKADLDGSEKILSFPKIRSIQSTSKVIPLRVTVLDVGQGLSVVVQTEGESGEHALVYDTGRGYEDGFNMADAVVIPYLRYRGKAVLDMLVVSHGDNDHAGGTKNIIDALSPKQVVLGEDVASGKFTFSYCKSGGSWQWDDVFFEFLHPREKVERESNNRSCVLKITYRDQVIILPGDIESSVERQLQQDKTLLEHPELFENSEELFKNSVTLLVAPHHGSKTSSSSKFVRMLAPKHVVFSAGHKHHFGHPAELVVKRYRDVGSKMWSTSDHGAIEFIWGAQGLPTISSRRIDSKRYWY